MAHSSLRFGIGRFTTEAEIDYVIERISAIVQRLRDMRYALCFLSMAILLILFTLVHCGRWYRRGLTLARLTGRSIKLHALRLMQASQVQDSIIMVQRRFVV